jgi:hypothetical protein
MQPWASAATLKPVVMKWLEAQSDEVMRLVASNCDSETWVPPQEPPFLANSAAEVVRIFEVSLNTLFDLGVPLHGSAVRSELELLGQSVRRYATCVTAGCDHAEALIRPPPPLTRYKKSLTVKAQAGKDVARCVLAINCLGCPGGPLTHQQAVLVIGITCLACAQVLSIFSKELGNAHASLTRSCTALANFSVLWARCAE